MRQRRAPGKTKLAIWLLFATQPTSKLKSTDIAEELRKGINSLPTTTKNKFIADNRPIRAHLRDLCTIKILNRVQGHQYRIPSNYLTLEYILLLDNYFKFSLKGKQTAFIDMLKGVGYPNELLHDYINLVWLNKTQRHVEPKEKEPHQLRIKNSVKAMMDATAATIAMKSQKQDITPLMSMLEQTINNFQSVCLDSNTKLQDRRWMEFIFGRCFDLLETYRILRLENGVWVRWQPYQPEIKS